MTIDNVRFGVNLMPQGWFDQPAKSGTGLLSHRARLFRHMAESGLDHVMVGDHMMFQGGVGNDGLIDAASVVTATDRHDVYLAVYLMVLARSMRSPNSSRRISKPVAPH